MEVHELVELIRKTFVEPIHFDFFWKYLRISKREHLSFKKTDFKKSDLRNFEQADYLA